VGTNKTDYGAFSISVNNFIIDDVTATGSGTSNGFLRRIGPVCQALEQTANKQPKLQINENKVNKKKTEKGIGECLVLAWRSSVRIPTLSFIDVVSIYGKESSVVNVFA
jgi:hypothetical protein